MILAEWKESAPVPDTETRHIETRRLSNTRIHFFEWIGMIPSQRLAAIAERHLEIGQTYGHHKFSLSVAL
jgi:hypothetical protein